MKRIDQVFEERLEREEWEKKALAKKRKRQKKKKNFGISRRLPHYMNF